MDITVTEKQAWKEIAEAFRTSRDKRTQEQDYTALFGVCHATLSIEIPEKIRESMDEKIWDCIEGTATIFCEYNRLNDKLRADWCFLMYYIGGFK